MSRGLLAAIGAVVFALLVGLVWAVSHGDSTPAARSAPAADSPAPSPPGPGPQVVAARPRTDAAPASVSPPPPVDPASAADADPTKPIVRDHTGEKPTGTPSPITQNSVAAIHGAAMPFLKTCAEPLRKADPAAKGRVYVTFTATSANGKVVVHDAAIAQASFQDPAVSDCIVRALNQITLDAPDGQGAGEHVMNMPFTVP